ncbi:hypothetical protein LOK49_LG04G00608 [Camellia lanceoleosa]|uniref:Uncharacterized protein n=1 Tax=Camellia lanceoleosa TaxID=1840588 RepID=A0ACC0HZJ2_9ERIC|nr:hypothetical protein LOK49_LG04G00608 [Camellia lanceoleosa]
MTKKIGEILENRIGRLIQVESQQGELFLSRSNLRFRVEVDTHEPFPRGFWLKRSQGEADIWITFKYEKLLDFCYDCRRVGHYRKICKFVSKEKGARSGYGPGIRAGVVKNLGSSYVSHHRQTDISETFPVGESMEHTETNISGQRGGA